MRYGIRLAALPQCCESLEQAARKQRQEIEALQSVIRRLGSLSGMSGVIAGLRRDLQNMEEQVRITLAMAQAARRVHQIYTDMELSILDALDCPFQLEPAGCGMPAFPSSSPSPGTPAVTGPQSAAPESNGQPADAPASPAASGSDKNAAVRRQNQRLLALLEKYFTAVFGKPAAKLAIARARQQLQLD